MVWEKTKSWCLSLWIYKNKKSFTIHCHHLEHNQINRLKSGLLKNVAFCLKQPPKNIPNQPSKLWHRTHLVGRFKLYCFGSCFNQVMNRAWHRKIIIIIAVFALSYCLFKPVQLRLLALYAPGCIPFETKAYFREVPLTKTYWWTRNQSPDKWPFYFKHSSIVSLFLLLGNKCFII